MQFLTDVSGQSVGPVFKGQAVQDGDHYDNNVAYFKNGSAARPLQQHHRGFKVESHSTLPRAREHDVTRDLRGLAGPEIPLRPLPATTPSTLVQSYWQNQAR